MPKRGKKYLNALEKIDRNHLYDPDEALNLIKEIAPANFDETVEVSVRLGIDPRHASAGEGSCGASSRDGQDKESACVCQG